MVRPKHQLPLQVSPLAVQDPSVMNPMDVSDPNAILVAVMQDGDLIKLGSITDHTKKLQDELEKMKCKIKAQEDKMIFLKTRKDNLDESILDLQVSLEKRHSASTKDNKNSNHIQTEEDTVEQILKQEKSAAGILYQLRTHHGSQASHLPITEDVLGIVATLGKVDNDNLSRLFSEYLGLDTMMAVVCKTFEGVKALESYDMEGRINQSSGIHGLGRSLGRHLDGRFLVICLEGLRPYVGDFITDHPQRKLDLMKPRLPSGECPPGFLGFAVNMIYLDIPNVSFLTANGHGLSETLFYSLFSRLQVYRTRDEMLLAGPCISYGALSLDGGMIKSVFFHVHRKDVEVRFAVGPQISMLPEDNIETEEQLKFMKWDKERCHERMQREEKLLNDVKLNFDAKRQEFLKFIAESSLFVTQQQAKLGSRMSRRSYLGAFFS